MFETLIALLEVAIGAQTTSNLWHEFKDLRGSRDVPEPEWNVFGFASVSDEDLNTLLDTLPRDCSFHCDCPATVAIIIRDAKGQDVFALACDSHRERIDGMIAQAEAEKRGDADASYVPPPVPAPSNAKHDDSTVIDAEFTVIEEKDAK